MQWSNLPCLANHPNWPAAAQLWDMSRGHNRSFINTIARQAHLMQICGVFTHIDSSFSCRRRPGNLVPFSIFSQFQNFNSFFNCSHRDGAPYSQSWVHGPCVLQWPQSTYHAWSRKITQGPRLAVKESNMLQHIAKPEILPKSRGPHPIRKMPFVASTTL